MAIVGIQKLSYGVEDVGESIRFFEDFGLPLVERAEDFGRFELAEGSEVLIRPLAAFLEGHSGISGPGVREVIWGVDNQVSLERLVDALGVDHTITRDDEGTARFVTPFGVPMGLRVFA